MRQRKHHAKVTSGCKTCKARRVKCDEGKPTCNQCKTTDRACGGYTVRKTWLFEPSKPTNHTPGPASPINIPFTIERSSEKRALAYFQERTALQLKCLSRSSDQFWKHDIPMFVATYPPVKHLVVAVASRHELATGMQIQQDVAQTYSKSYAAALSELLELPPVGTEDVFLMSSILMIALEAFGDPLSRSDAAVQHANSGFRIIDEINLRGSSVQAHASIVELIMKPMFARIGAVRKSSFVVTGTSNLNADSIPVTLFLPCDSSDKVLWKHWQVRPELPSMFLNLDIAKKAFLDICRWRHQYGVVCDKSLWTSSSPEFLDVQSLLRQWWKAFKAYESKVPASNVDERYRISCFDSSFRFLMRTFRASAEWQLVKLSFKIYDLTIDLRSDDELVITYATKSSLPREVVTQQHPGLWISSGPLWLWPVTTFVGTDGDKLLLHSVLNH